MHRIPATKFKAQCLELMDRVAERRESYEITKRGKPVARLVPIKEKPTDSIFGCLRSKVLFCGDIESPALPPEAWETVKEWDELMGGDKPLVQDAPKGRKNKRSRR